MIAELVQRMSWKLKGVRVWQPSNIYLTAELCRNVSVGKFSEIGHFVHVGDNTRIGMGCFIPQGTWIGKNCFLGPKVCFVHDKLLWDKFPSGDSHWQHTVVGDGAVIGANALICPGISIGEDALIGIGSVITKDVGPNEVWFGNPAKFIRMREV